MTLPRYVAATRQSSAQIVLEPDIELTAFVRRHLASDPQRDQGTRHGRPPQRRTAAGTPTSPASWPPLDPKTPLTPLPRLASLAEAQAKLAAIRASEV